MALLSNISVSNVNGFKNLDDKSKIRLNVEKRNFYHRSSLKSLGLELLRCQEA